MSYQQMIDAQNRKGDIATSKGAAKVRAFGDAADAIAGEAGKYAERKFSDEQRRKSEEATLGRQKESESWQSGEKKKERDIEAENAQAIVDSANSLRSGGAPDAAPAGQGAPAQGGAAAPGVVPTKFDAAGNPIGGSAGTPGPVSPSLMKLGHFTDVHAAEVAIRMLKEDEETRYRRTQERLDMEAAGRALDMTGTGNPQNPTAGIPGMDLARAAHGGYADDVARSAAALRQSGYIDPQQEEETARRHGFEDVTRPQQIAQNTAETKLTGAQTVLATNQAAAALRNSQPAPPKRMTAAEVNQLLATSTGRQHEELKALAKQKEEAMKVINSPYGADPEQVTKAQVQIDSIDSRMNDVKAEIDAVSAQWFGTLKQLYPGLSLPSVPSAGPGPGTGAPGIDLGAIDAALQKRGVAVPPQTGAPAGK